MGQGFFGIEDISSNWEGWEVRAGELCAVSGATRAGHTCHPLHLGVGDHVPCVPISATNVLSPQWSIRLLSGQEVLVTPVPYTRNALSVLFSTLKEDLIP